MDEKSSGRKSIMHREVLNARQARFVAHFVVNQNAKAAALAAGYGIKAAGAQGSRMLRLPAVANAITEARDRIRMAVPRVVREAEISASRVLTEVAKMANYDSPDVTPDTRYRSKLPANQFLGEFLKMIQPAQVSAGPLFQINIHTTPRDAGETRPRVIDVTPGQLGEAGRYDANNVESDK